MWNARLLAATAIGIALVTPGVAAQDLLPSHRIADTRVGHYRNFVLKSDLATVSTGAGVAASEAKTVHERPAVLQDLQWRPSRFVPRSSVASPDPIDEVLFSFYDDQLFRIVVDYARDRIEGMTDADMIDAITAVYGAPGKQRPGTAGTWSRVEAESGPAVARWGDADHSVVLYRLSTYGAGFRLIVTDRDLDRLARRATAEAARLDEQDAPRLERERQRKEREDARASADQARTANKAGFRP